MSFLEEYKNRMIEKAVTYQQNFYELLPDWTVYKKSDIKYLKQNIGYAIFGPPQFGKKSNSNDLVVFTTGEVTNDTDICDLVHYDSKAKSMINLIVDKICKYGSKYADDDIICGTIYLMIFDNGSSVQHKNQNEKLIALPLFKILKYNDKNLTSKQKSKDKIQDMFTTWYIDIKGRIYKGWDDFMKTNDLPQCIMVYPKDGFHQPDPIYTIDPDNSVVWVIAEDSIACSKRSKVVSAINETVNTVGAGAAIVLGAASLVNPIAPAVATAGLMTAGLTGLWTIGKSSTELYDRKMHNESISLLNESALSSWLGIAGSTVGLAASGGGILLKNAAMTGSNVGKVAKAAYNISLVGSISINLIGLGYQGINISKKYLKTGEVEMQDLLYFGTHLLFFINNIVNVKFANDIIKITQGTVLQEYEQNLRNYNLRSHYEYATRQSAGVEAYTIEQNSAVLRYMNKFDRNNISAVWPVTNFIQSLNNIVTVQQYKLKFNGITLLNPMTFVVNLAKSYLRETMKASRNSPNSLSVDNTKQLMKIVDDLLSQLYTSEDCPKNEQLLLIPDFKALIDDLKGIKYAEHILPVIFKTALTITKTSNMYSYLVEGCRFVWDYVKMNMHEKGLKLYSSYENHETDSSFTSERHMWAIFTALSAALDKMANQFFNALHQYIHLNKTVIGHS